MKKQWIIILLIGLVGVGVYQMASGRFGQTREKSPVTAGLATQQVIGLQKGNLAPDFELVTTGGKHIKLSELRGKKTIVNMWATWCPPCKAEVPDLERFYEEHHNEGLEIVAVDLTTSEKRSGDVEKFIKEYNITYPVVLDELGEVAKQYQVTSIPVTYVVNSQGVIQQKHVGALSYQDLAAIFAKLD